MIKESINTFNEGMNLDLNPITTPQNVLTDCVNGTFITFNGDELALQNDAGNTTIDYNGVPVRLSTGFYPIGIKEYGGVLYIVSAKDPTIVPIEFDENDTYDQGEVIFREISGVNYYYESLLDDNGETLPLVSNEFWKYVGVEKDFKNQYGFVEFGSYPSPEIINADLIDTSTEYLLTNLLGEDIKNQLYSPKVVNDTLFRAGTYVSFFNSGSVLDTDNVSYSVFELNALNKIVKNESTSVKKIYKVKLYQQLSNGFIDLTEDVWAKFAEYVYATYTEELNITGTPRFWFDEVNFKYYCPHNFKGKLIISVELENLDKFSLNRTTTAFDTVNYTVSFYLNQLNNTAWETLASVAMCYTLDGSEPNFDLATSSNFISTHNGITTIDEISTFDKLFVAANGGKTLRYKIRPELVFDGGEIPYAEFPAVFTEAHTISGTLLLTSELDEYILSLVDTVYISDPLGTTGRVATLLTLTDQVGNLLDNEFAPSMNAFQFYLSGQTPPANPLGTYTVGADGKADLDVLSIVNVITPASFQNYIVSVLENTTVYEPFVDYGTVTLTIEVNKTFNSTPIIVTQGSVIILPNTPSYGPVFTYTIDAGIAFTVKPNTGLGLKMDALYWHTDTVTANTSIYFGLVTDLTIVDIDYTDPDLPLDDRTEYNLYTSMSSTNFGTPIATSRFAATQININYPSSTLPMAIRSGNSGSIYNLYWTDLVVGEYPEFTVTFNNLGTNVYDNLTGIDIATENDHIFLKTQTFTGI